MKALFALLFILPLFAAAQQCDIKKEVDPFTQQPLVSTGFMHFSGSAATLNIVADAREVKLLFYLGQGTCIDEKSAVYFLYDGSKTKSRQKNYSTMNCEGILTVIFRNAEITPSALKKLTEQKLTAITLTDAADKKIEIVLTDAEKEALLQKAACLLQEAKHLSS